MKGNEKYLTLTPVKAIRAYCLDCCNGQWTEVKRCTRDGVQSELCPLFRYRLGHRPKSTENYGATEGGSDFDCENEETTPSEE